MEYLSDRELQALMELSESEGLLTAPKDTKANVLAQLQPKKAAPKKQFYAYCLRVGLAMAACLAILLLPAPTEKSVSDTPTISLSHHLNQFTDALEQGLSDINERGNDFDFNFGGTRDE